MSPQGTQAQFVIQQIQGYSPKRDTKSHSLLRRLQQKADEMLAAGVLPENERAVLRPGYLSALSRVKV